MGNRKYFFAYHDFHGQSYPFAWVEEDGLSVGGRPRFLVNDLRWEISEHEFNGTLGELEKRYPLTKVTP